MQEMERKESALRKIAESSASGNEVGSKGPSPTKQARKSDSETTSDEKQREGKSPSKHHLEKKKGREKRVGEKRE